MIYLVLHPREADLLDKSLFKASGHTENAHILREACKTLDPISGLLDLDEGLLDQVKRAAKNWQLGGQKEFAVLVEAAGRHGY